MPEFRLVDEPPQSAVDFHIVDNKAEEDKATALWNGTPVTLGTVKKVAEANGTTPDAVMTLGTATGKFESRLAKTAVGQGILRAGQGLEGVAQSVVGSVARAAGYESIYDRIQQDKKRRNDFLNFVEKGGDVSAALGERGSRIYGETLKTVGNAGGAAVAGPMSVYSLMVNDAWQGGLDDAQANGLSGADSIGHAGRSAAITGVISYMMGRIPGISTLETSFSGAARNEIQNFIQSPTMKGKMVAAAKELGGIAASGAEQMMISAGLQINGSELDPSKEFDWNEVFEQGQLGAWGRGAIGAMKGLDGVLKGYQKKLPEVVKGIRAADIDMDRGVNPLEAREVSLKDMEAQTGHKEMTKTAHNSYREALNFYVDEARQNGRIGAMTKFEKDLQQLRQSEREASERIAKSKEDAAKQKAKGTPGQKPTAQPEPEPVKTINERASFSLEEFEKRMAPQAKEAPIVDPKPPINPYIRVPWESETRVQGQLRVRSRDLAAAKETISGLREGLKATQRLTKEQQDTALELVQREVPKADQWKFGRNVLDATRPKLVDKLLDRIVKHVDATDHRLAVDGLKESFKKASNLRTEFQELAKGVRQSVDVRKFNSKAAAEQIKQWADDNPHALLTKEDTALVERLGKTNVTQMSPDDIRNLSSYVEGLAYESAAKDRLIGFQESASVRDTGDLIVQQASKVKPLEMKADSALRKAFGDTDFVENDRTIISSALHEVAERPEVTLNRVSPELANRLYGEVRLARSQFKNRVKNTTLMLSQVFDAVGLPHEQSVNASLKAAIGRPGTRLNEWREQKRDIDGVTLSRGEALQLVRWLDDPVAAKSLTKNGVKLSGGREFKELGPTTLQNLAYFVGEEGMAIKNAMFEHDNSFVIDGVNDANQRMTGRQLTEKRNVVPIVRADDVYQKLISTARGGSGMREALADSYGHLRHREGGDRQLKVPDDMDGIDMFMSHAERMHRFAEYSVPARNAELLLNNPEVKNTLVSKNGNQGYDHILDTVRAEVAGFAPTDKTTKNLARFNSLVAGTMIAGKLSVMAGQPLDTITAQAYNPNGFAELGAGMKEWHTRGLQDIKAEMDAVLGTHSGEYWSRNQQDGYAGEVTSGQFKKRGYFRPSSILQQGFRPFNMAEFYSAQMPNYLAAKAAARAQFGLKEDDYHPYADNPDWVKSVVDRWEGDTYRGSNSSDAMELPASLQYAKQNPAAGLVMNFYNTATKVYSLFSAGAYAAQSGDYKSAVRYLGAAGVSTAMFAAMQEALSLGEKDKEKHGFIHRAAVRALTNTVGLYPVGGQIIADEVVRPMMGLQQFDSNPLLLADTVTKAANGAGVIIGQLTGLTDKALKPEQMLQQYQELAKNAGSLLSLPVPAIIDYTRRAKKIYDGEGALPGTTSPTTKPKKSKKRRRSNDPYA